MTVTVNDEIGQDQDAPQPAAQGGLRVNPELADDETTLPEGVYRVQTDIPAERVELFRIGADGDTRIYTIPRKVNPRHSMGMLRDIRKGGGQEVALTNFMYAVLGDAVMDALADEELSEEEFEAVMKAVRKHATGAMKKTLGNF